MEVQSDSATKPYAQAAEAVLAAPLGLTEVRVEATDAAKRHGLPPPLLAWLHAGFDRGGYQVRHFRPVRAPAPPPAAGTGRGGGTTLGGGRRPAGAVVGLGVRRQ